MRIKAAALFGALALAGPAEAQMGDGSAQRAAMDRVGFMVGRWRGDAWMQQPGGRVSTTMTETIERRLGGAVLLIEGRGVIPAAGGVPERVAHHALGILSFDPASGYSLRSCIAQGYCGDFAVSVTDSSLVWSREVPGGRIRNTARYTATTWTEIGEFSRDGTTWMQTMEIRLRREP